MSNPQEPQPRELDSTVGEPRSGEPESFSFLSPPTRAGSLGRIGHYEVLEFVGKGAMGLVFKALDDELQRIVAVKVLAPELATSAVSRNRFIREARAAAAVAYEHVVTIHAVEGQSVPPYLVMQLISGISLQDRISSSGQLSVLEITRIASQTAMGLAAAHKQGLVHRDIKPANILLENGVERVKITDFGLARASDDAQITQTGVIAGTPQYMSPEQAMGQPLDGRSDLFSLGSVLYTMCTGRPAFRAESALAVLKRVCEDAPRPIREVNPEIPQWLAEIVGKLLEKKPENRFQSAREVADLLSEHLAELQYPSGRVIPAVQRGLSDSASAAFGKTSARRRWIAIAAGSATLVAVVVWSWKPFKIPEHVLQPTQTAGAKPRTDAPPSAVTPFTAEQAKTHQETWAKYLDLPVEFTNGVGMNLRLLPPGEFLMGSTQAEVDQLLAELTEQDVGEFEKFVAARSTPQHLVRITEPYYLGRSEVTMAQYRRFVEAAKYVSSSKRAGSASFDWQDFRGDSDELKQPVVGVSWEDATEYCKWLSLHEQQTYELPTEAQWEYACRAGTTGLWSHGDDPGALADYAVVGMNTPRPAAIETRRSNQFGLFDMHGNVDEWCRDWHLQAFYQRGAVSNPVNSDTPADPASGRVARGGSWNAQPWWSRSATRTYDSPRSPAMAKGFRVAVVGDLRLARPSASRAP